MPVESKLPRLLQAPPIWILLACLVAIALKAWIVCSGLAPFNSDEAVVALMARHILQGESPIFFYGQAYMGSLDAYLVAIGFWLFGQSVWVIRWVQGILYLGIMLSTVWLAYVAYASWKTAAIAVLLLAIPTVNLTLYTTVSLGGYGEALLIGNFILLLALGIHQDWRAYHFPGRLWKWAVLGFLIGLGLWAFGISLVFSAAALLYLFLVFWDWSKLVNQNQHQSPEGFTLSLKSLIVPVTILLAGILLGAAPWWGYALKFGLRQLIWELGGGAIAGVEQVPWIVQTWQHLVNLILLGSTAAMGFRPPWDVTWLALPLIPLVLFFWVLVAITVVKDLPRRLDKSIWVAGKTGLETGWVHVLWILVVVILVAGFVLTPFGADPSGRYFVPLSVPLVMLAAWSMVKLSNTFGVRVYSLLGVVLIFNLWGTMQCAQRIPPGFTTQFYAPTQIDRRFDQELIDFLQSQGEVYGYSNYWVSYPLAFLSQESLIYLPALPYHQDFRYTQRDDRYQPYRDRVSNADRVAYITTRHDALDAKLRVEFNLRSITWEEKVIGDYHIFYKLSALIHPTEMGLGITTHP